MGRPARFQIAGIPQLISQRGHNRLPCFVAGDDFTAFSELLAESAAQYNCQILALVMVPESYWILAVPSDSTGISRMIQRTGRCFVRHSNTKYRREGTLWASRYSACLVEPSTPTLRQCSGFLRSLPTRKGIVAPGSEWPWMNFDESLPEPGETEQGCSDTTHQHILSVLKSGLVLGSETFQRSLASSRGIKVAAARPGRPPATTPEINL